MNSLDEGVILLAIAIAPSYYYTVKGSGREGQQHQQQTLRGRKLGFAVRQPW
jgi:hypothetical protein